MTAVNNIRRELDVGLPDVFVVKIQNWKTKHIATLCIVTHVAQQTSQMPTSAIRVEDNWKTTSSCRSIFMWS